MLKRIGVVWMLALLAAVLTFPQPSAAQGTAQIGFHNLVTVTARHCQNYERSWLGKVFHRDRYDFKACAADASTVYYRHTSHNLVTNAGFDAISSQIANTATQAAACNYIALSNDAAAPAAGDTAVASEITTNGLARAQGTYNHTAGTKVFTVSKVFTFTGTQASQKAGLLNAASTGTLCSENTYTQVTGNSGDTLTVTWTWTLS